MRGHPRRWLARDPITGAPGGSPDDSVCLRHVTHPSSSPTGRTLAEVLDACADERLLAVLRDAWGEEPMFRSTSLLFNPTAMRSDGQWHRDTQFAFPDVEREGAHLAVEFARGSGGAQIQIALVANADLEYVPGSHRRWDTDEEHRIRLGDDKRHAGDALPTARRIAQEVGDAAFFIPSGLHRGRYHAERPRCSLMLTYTRASAPPHIDRFSHQPWCLAPGFLDGVAPTTRAAFDRFIAHYRAAWLDPGDTSDHHSGF